MYRVSKVSSYPSLQGLQAAGRWENTVRQSVPDFTSERDKGMKILVISAFVKSIESLVQEGQRNVEGEAYLQSVKSEEQ